MSVASSVLRSHSGMTKWEAGNGEKSEALVEKHCGEPLAACLQLLCTELLGRDCLPVPTMLPSHPDRRRLGPLQFWALICSIGLTVIGGEGKTSAPRCWAEYSSAETAMQGSEENSQDSVLLVKGDSWRDKLFLPSLLTWFSPHTIKISSGVANLLKPCTTVRGKRKVFIFHNCSEPSLWRLPTLLDNWSCQLRKYQSPLLWRVSFQPLAHCLASSPDYLCTTAPAPWGPGLVPKVVDV